MIVFAGRQIGSGGLSDRIRGLYNVYLLCKKYKRELYVNLWEIPHVKIKYPSHETNGLIFKHYMACSHSTVDGLINMFENNDNSAFYTNVNINFLKDREPELFKNNPFSSYFKDMFDISEFLKVHGIPKYDIGIQCRFGGGMVDWHDPNLGLDPQITKTKIIEKSKEYEDKTIFLTSDSSRFLKEIEDLKLPNVTITTVVPNHTDPMRQRNKEPLEKIWEKTFIDLLTLAHCQTIYNTKGGFGFMASKIFDHELHPLI